MSAMAVVEAIKLSITLCQLMLANHGNIVACITTFKGVNKRVYLAYSFLAISYAAYNQIIFHIMKLVDPGTLSLFKSLGPGVVALLNFIAYQRKLSQAQVMCIMIQTFSIVPVTASLNSETGKVSDLREDVCRHRISFVCLKNISVCSISLCCVRCNLSVVQDPFSS